MSTNSYEAAKVNVSEYVCMLYVPVRVLSA